MRQMLSSLIVAIALVEPPIPAKLLFLGNSHTSNHDIPTMVKNLMMSDRKHRQVQTQAIYGGHLRDIFNRPNTIPTIRNGRFTHVILQAQEISMSHKFNYSKKEGIQLAIEAEKARARAIFFSEWPRRGIVETDYIYNIYAGMAAKSNAEVVPVGHVWDAALAKKPTLDLWDGDGNHSKALGAYLAAMTIYFFIAGPNAKPNWRPANVDGATQKLFENLARKLQIR